jgi:hypothetical protein
MKTSLALFCSLFLFASSCFSAEGVKQLSWDDLVPPAKPGEHNQPRFRMDFGNLFEPLAPPEPAEIVPALNGQDARIAGFIVPLEGDGVDSVAEFLLVPYFGACIHVPPPPANQIIFVRLQKPYKLAEDMWNPYWIEGTLHTENVDAGIGVAGYTMKVRTIEPYKE